MHVNCCYVLIQMWVVPVGPAAVQVNCSNSSFATIIRALYHCLPIHAVGYVPHTGWIIFFFTRLTINRERNYNLCPASPLPGNPPPFHLQSGTLIAGKTDFMQSPSVIKVRHKRLLVNDWFYPFCSASSYILWSGVTGRLYICHMVKVFMTADSTFHI